ncbi:threonine synthase [compost metagenome]
MHDIEQGRIPAGSVITCTLTGHGLKDPDIAITQSSAPVVKVDAKLDSVKKAILDNMK